MLHKSLIGSEYHFALQQTIQSLRGDPSRADKLADAESELLELEIEGLCHILRADLDPQDVMPSCFLFDEAYQEAATRYSFSV